MIIDEAFSHNFQYIIKIEIYVCRFKMSYRRGSGNKAKGFGFAGFQMTGTKRSGANIPPPTVNPNLSKQGYHTMNSITENALSACWGVPKKRSKTEEE